MFSVSVVETDNFLDLSFAAQALYFHLSMFADDDGFVSSHKKIMRSIGCNEDSMEELVNAGFVTRFATGVIVIMDWNVNNTLKSDRYNQTIYQSEKALLGLSTSKRYYLSGQEEPVQFQDGSTLVPQYSLGKESIGKSSLGEPRGGKGTGEPSAVQSSQPVLGFNDPASPRMTDEEFNTKRNEWIEKLKSM
jgi:hypothetical protein